MPWNQIALCNGKTAAEKHSLCFLVNGNETIIHGIYGAKFILLHSSAFFLYKRFSLCHHRRGTPCTACRADLPSLSSSDSWA